MDTELCNFLCSLLKNTYEILEYFVYLCYSKYFKMFSTMYKGRKGIFGVYGIIARTHNVTVWLEIPNKMHKIYEIRMKDMGKCL